MNWTIDQLKILVTAVEQGSFSAAARKLGKVQSRISAAISDLEASLNFELFDRSGRYPKLTAEGRKIYVEAKAILTQCERMQACALTVSLGEESQLVLAMDEALPVRPFRSVFIEMAEEYPALTLNIMTGAKDLVVHWVENEIADIGVLTNLNDLPDSLEQLCHNEYKYVIIVSDSHPLSKIKKPSIQDLSLHRQLVVSDHSNKYHIKPISTNHWFVNHYHCTALLVSLDIGWAVVPEYIADKQIELTNLVKLPTGSIPNTFSFATGTIKRFDHANGPVMTELYDKLINLP